MTQQQILDEVANSDWQPEFEFTEDLDAVVDSILKPHEDYFLGLHEKVKEIIKREIENVKELQFIAKHEPVEDVGWATIQRAKKGYQITFADVCNWQKELFEHKRTKIETAYWVCSESFNSKLEDKLNNLPNKYINLGPRQSNVKVGGWTPPAPMFLEDLKEMCFPLDVNAFSCNIQDQVGFVDPEDVKGILTDWYKICMTIHPWEDFNGRLGAIVINILSFILTGKYLIRR